MNKNTIETLWKQLANDKRNTAANHIQYAILRAMASKGEDKLAIAKHFLRKAFSPVSNRTKLANGAQPFQALNQFTNNARIYGENSVILGVKASTFMTEEEIVQYNQLYAKVSPQSLIRRYAYFFTRQDIFAEYQLVQTAHVALELGNKLTAEQVKDLHFTCCGVKDLYELEALKYSFEEQNIPHVEFREPDIGNQLTSIAVFPVEEHKRGWLRKFPLLRFNRPQPAVVEEAVTEQVD